MMTWVLRLKILKKQPNRCYKKLGRKQPSFLPIIFRGARGTRACDPRGEFPFPPLGNPIGLSRLLAAEF